MDNEVANSELVKRRFPRFPVELPCLYSTDNGPDRAFHEAVGSGAWE